MQLQIKNPAPLVALEPGDTEGWIDLTINDALVASVTSEGLVIHPGAGEFLDDVNIRHNELGEIAILYANQRAPENKSAEEVPTIFSDEPNGILREINLGGLWLECRVRYDRHKITGRVQARINGVRLGDIWVNRAFAMKMEGAAVVEREEALGAVAASERGAC